MTSILVFLPLILLIAIPLFYLFISQKVKFTAKITHWLFLGYVTILLLAMVGSYFIKGKEFVKAEEIFLHPLLLEGKIEEIDKSYIMMKESIPYEGEELFIKNNAREDIYSIFIEEKEENDGKIDITMLGNINVGGLNLTEMLKPPKIQISGEELIVSPFELQEIKVANVRNELVIIQIRPENESFSTSSNIEYPYIYLRIPKGLTIVNNPNLYIEYVK